MKSTNRKFEIEILVEDHEAHIKVEAVEEFCLKELAEAIYVDGCNIQLEAFMANGTKKVEIEIVPKEDKAFYIEKIHPWHNMLSVLSDIAEQYTIK